MSEIGPDDEVSLSLELKENGLEGKVKGRALSIFQRWLGPKFAVSIVKNERAAAREKVLGALEQRALKQLGTAALENLKGDPTVLDGLIEALQLPDAKRKIENKSAVFEDAIEELSLRPPTDRESAEGPAELTPEIADRLEMYASGATTDEVRKRWGRVVAAEIRTPGTFSLKVLRIIDELDDKLPALFERLASARIHDDCVPRCLAPELSYTETIDLVDAGLIHDPGSGGAFQLRYFTTGTEHGSDAWLFPIGEGDTYVTLPRTGTFAVAGLNSSDPLIANEGKPAVPSYLLTSAGSAIVSILPPVENGSSLLSKIRDKCPEARMWSKSGEDRWLELSPVPDTTEAPALEQSEPSEDDRS